MPDLKPNEILQELRRLVALAEIEVTPLLPDSGFKSAYAPLNAYLDQLQRGTKPETASEGILRALVKLLIRGGSTIMPAQTTSNQSRLPIFRNNASALVLRRNHCNAPLSL